MAPAPAGAATAACQTDDTPVPDPAIDGLLKLEISPGESAFVIEASKPAEIDFKVIDDIEQAVREVQGGKLDVIANYTAFQAIRTRYGRAL